MFLSFRQRVLRRGAAAAALLAALVAATGCDRTTKRGLASTAEPPAATAGPRNISGGVLFAFVAPEAQSVHLAGSFNSWSTSADPMVKDASGRWQIVKAVPPGTHQYKFVLNGGAQWKEDPTNPASADDGYGGKNSLLEVGADGKIVAAVAAGGTAPAPTATAAPKSSGAVDSGPQKTDSGWLFTFDMPGAASVHLAGSFNSWSTSADPLAKNAAGLWTIVKALPAGAHQYKFVIDGGQQWKQDPGNSQSADDGFGGKNSLLVVP